jgi:hypothetical protein
MDTALSYGLGVDGFSGKKGSMKQRRNDSATEADAHTGAEFGPSRQMPEKFHTKCDWLRLDPYVSKARFDELDPVPRCRRDELVWTWRQCARASVSCHIRTFEIRG